MENWWKSRLLRRGRLQVRLTTLVVLGAGLLLISSVTLITLRAQNQMTSDADDRLQLANRTLAVSTATWLDLNIRALDQMVMLPPMVAMDADTQKPFLETMHQAFPHMYLISTTDLSGVNVARSDDGNLTDYSDRVWVQGALAGQPLTYQSLVGRTSGEPALVISAPIRDDTGEIVGVGMFASDLNDITDEVHASKIGDTGFAYIVDADNRVIAHPDTALTAELKDFSDDPPVTFARDGQTGLMEFDDAGSSRWRTYVDVLDNGWVVIVRQQESELFEPLREFRVVVVVVALIGLVVLAGLTWILLSLALRPVALLTETAVAIAGGDLDRRAPVVTDDEIGTLATTFNSMTEQLRGLIGNLEQRVSARTRDLEIASSVARQITTVLNLDDLLQQVVALTATGFGFDIASILLYDADQAVLVRVAGANAQGESLDMSGPQGKQLALSAEPSIIAQAARTRQLVNVGDVTRSSAYLSGFEEIRSELAIPMVLGDRLIGVFDVQSALGDRFSDEDQSVLETLAEQTAIAVRNAQLFAEAAAAREISEQASRAKSQFLAAMSHELRTPLNGILNFTQFVSSGMMGPVTERQIEFLNKATANGEHLLSLINDVLDISKIESHSLKLFVEDDVDLKPIVDTVVATGSSMLQDKPVELIVDVADELPSIRADERRIAQILLNLVSNACKFTEAGTVRLRGYQADGNVMFVVEDTGPGIAPKEQAAVFEVFGQTESGLKKGEGTGLGMPISRSLAEAHGGRLWLESELGEGSKFYVSLPIQAATRDVEG